MQEDLINEYQIKLERSYKRQKSTIQGVTLSESEELHGIKEYSTKMSVEDLTHIFPSGQKGVQEASDFIECLETLIIKSKKARDEIQKTEWERKQKREFDENLQCCVCFDNKKEILILPCRHLCICEKCSEGTGAASISKCPVCRCAISQKLKVYS